MTECFTSNEDFHKDVIAVLKSELGNVRVKDICTTAGSVAGDNNLSEVSRVTVKYEKCNGEVGIKCFIVKDVRKSASDFVTKICGIEKENSWYEKIVPEVNKLGYDIGASCYKMYNDWLLLDDLRTYGYKVANRIKLLDLDEILQAVKVLAEFHAVTHHLHNLNLLPEIAERNTIFLKDSDGFMYDRFKNFDKIIENLAETGNIKYNKIIKDLQPVAWKKMIECVDQRHEFLCLVHGDYWTTNILFKYDNNKVTNAKMIDFQLMRLSTPAYDLHFFICTSIKPQIRDIHLKEILNVYLKTLNTTLKTIGSKSFLTQEKFNEIMERSNFVGVYTALTFLPVPLCESPLIFQPPQDLSEEEKKRYSPFHVVFKQNTYRNHLLSLLDYYNKQNVISI